MWTSLKWRDWRYGCRKEISRYECGQSSSSLLVGTHRVIGVALIGNPGGMQWEANLRQMYLTLSILLLSPYSLSRLSLSSGFGGNFEIGI